MGTVLTTPPRTVFKLTEELLAQEAVAALAVLHFGLVLVVAVVIVVAAVEVLLKIKWAPVEAAGPRVLKMMALLKRSRVNPAIRTTAPAA